MSTISGKSWRERADAAIAHGALTNSKRPSAFVDGVYPTHAIGGNDAFIQCADGKHYIDFICGLGTNLFGYTKDEQWISPTLSLPSIDEVELAEDMKNITEMDKIRFFKTGTEGCMAALRIARASASGKFVCQYGYSGWSDQFIAADVNPVGLPPTFLGLYKFKRTEDMLNYLRSATHIGVVIIEPYKDGINDIAGIIDVVRFCKDHDIKIIMDETITFLRVPDYLVSLHFDLDPDIIVCGKALGGGYPISAVCMKDYLAEKEWFCSGTFCGDLSAIGAASMTLFRIRDEDAKPTYNQFLNHSKDFMSKLNTLLNQIDVNIEGYGTRGTLSDGMNSWLFMQEACKELMLFGKAYFYSYAHMRAPDLDQLVLEQVEKIVQKIKAGGVVLEGKPPQAPLHRRNS